MLGLEAVHLILSTEKGKHAVNREAKIGIFLGPDGGVQIICPEGEALPTVDVIFRGDWEVLTPAPHEKATFREATEEERQAALAEYTQDPDKPTAQVLVASGIDLSTVKGMG